MDGKKKRGSSVVKGKKGGKDGKSGKGGNALKNKPPKKKQMQKKPTQQFKNAKPQKKETPNKKRKREDQPQKSEMSAEDAQKSKKFKKHTEMTDLMKQLKKIWENCRTKALSAEERHKDINNILELSKGQVADLIFKHDASRIFQTCFKYGTAAHRSVLTEELKERALDLAKSHYAKFLLIKMFKYASKDESLRDLLRGKAMSLLKHKEACIVIEWLYENPINSKAKFDLLLEFYGPEFALFKPEKKTKLEDILKGDKAAYALKHLQENINILINKGVPVIRQELVHHLIYEFITHAEYSKAISIIPNLKDLLIEFLQSRDGVKVACFCISHGNAKDRKMIIKQFKEFVDQIAVLETGHIALLRLMDVTDDFTLLSKAILTPLKSKMNELISDKYGYLCYMYALCPKSPKYFPPSTIELLSPTVTVQAEDGSLQQAPVSKKPIEERQGAILRFFSESLLQYAQSNTAQLLADDKGNNLLLEILLHAQGEKTNIYKSLLEMMQQVNEEGSSVMEDQRNSRFFSKLIKNAEDTQFAVLVAEQLKDKHKWAVKKGASFVILSLLETDATKNKVKQELLPHLKTLSKSQEVGCKILVTKLQ